MYTAPWLMRSLPTSDHSASSNPVDLGQIHLRMTDNPYKQCGLVNKDLFVRNFSPDRDQPSDFIPAGTTVTRVGSFGFSRLAGLENPSGRLKIEIHEADRPERVLTTIANVRAVLANRISPIPFAPGFVAMSVSATIAFVGESGEIVLPGSRFLANSLHLGSWASEGHPIIGFYTTHDTSFPNGESAIAVPAGAFVLVSSWGQVFHIIHQDKSLYRVSI